LTKNHFSVGLPYKGTTIDVETTQADISGMLKQFGVKAVRWTSESDVMDGKALPTLEFVVETVLNGVKKKIGIRVKPVLLQKSVGQGYHKRFTGAPEQSMRLLYWWLKSKLEAVRYGLETVESVLLSQVMVNLPDGGVTTMGERLTEQLGLNNNFDKVLPEFVIVNPKGSDSDD